MSFAALNVCMVLSLLQDRLKEMNRNAHLILRAFLFLCGRRYSV